MRGLLAAILGGTVLFLWGAFSHMVLPLGEMGMRSMPAEAPLLDAMRAHLPGDGLYFFPGYGTDGHPTKEQEEAWTARYMSGPTGILVYHARGSTPMSPKQLATELLSNIVAAGLAAFLLRRLATGFGTVVLTSMLIGVFGWLTISVPYWNWYGFPAAFTAGELIDQVVGWGLVGMVIGKGWHRRR